MRLWSLDPSYLDAKGLVAVWREGLLALKVLQGRTKGYKGHPQLQRFRAAKDPVAAINRFLKYIYRESVSRGYRFDPGKITMKARCHALPVTAGQLRFELGHLRGKLRQRDPQRYARIRGLRDPVPHPLFVRVPGAVEEWERGVARVRA